jgi:hypothetical protein
LRLLIGPSRDGARAASIDRFRARPRRCRPSSVSSSSLSLSLSWRSRVATGRVPTVAAVVVTFSLN